jgi:hypothetical protein
MSNTGDSTVSCGLPHVRLDWASNNQFSPYTTSLIGLWPLILGLHRPCSQHATVPSTLSSEGQLLVYPPCFSGLTPTGERDSCATWAQYYGGSVALRLASCRRSRFDDCQTLARLGLPFVSFNRLAAGRPPKRASAHTRSAWHHSMSSLQVCCDGWVFAPPETRI